MSPNPHSGTPTLRQNKRAVPASISPSHQFAMEGEVKMCSTSSPCLCRLEANVLLNVWGLQTKPGPLLQPPQPSLPLRPGQVERHTRDYKRNGTTILFVALNIANREVIGQCHSRHRRQEFLKFLNQLDAIRRGSFNSVAHLVGAIKAFLFHWNEGAKPYCMDKNSRTNPGKSSQIMKAIYWTGR